MSFSFIIKREPVPPAYTEYTQSFGVTSYVSGQYFDGYYFGTTFRTQQWEIQLGRSGTTRLNAWFWTPSVAIEKDATIMSAIFKGHVRQGAGNTLSLTASVSDEASATWPTSIASYTSKPKTSGTDIYPVIGSTDSYMSFPDIKDEVQQLVNRADWVSGNNMNIYLMQNLVADYDAAARLAAARGANDYGYSYASIEITWRVYS